MAATGFLRGFTTNAICMGLTFGLGTVNQALIARGLGTEGRGQLGLVVTTVMFSSLLFGEWLSRGNTYVTGKERKAQAAVANTVVYCLAVTAVGTLLMAVGGASLVASLGIDFLESTQLAVVGAIVILTVSHRSIHAVLLGQDRMTFYAVIPLFFIGTYLGGNFLAIIYGTLELTHVLISWVAAGLMVTVITLAPYIYNGLTRIDIGLFRRTGNVGLRGAVSVMLVFAMFRCDVYIVGYFLGDGSLGVYMIAIVVAEMMQRLPNVAGVVLLPKIVAGRDYDDRLSLLVARNVLGFSLVAAIAIWLVGGLFIELLFGSEYASAYGPLRWMLPGLIASGYGSVLNTRLAGQGYPAITMWAPAAALATKVAGSVAFVPVLGTMGAALSTSVAYVLWAVIVTTRYARVTSVTWRDFLRGKQEGG